MPRYFFHLEDDDRPGQDKEGSEHAGLDEAKCAAVKLIADTLCHHPQKFWNAETYRVTATDERGLFLFTVEMIATLSAAVHDHNRR